MRAVFPGNVEASDTTPPITGMSFDRDNGAWTVVDLDTVPSNMKQQVSALLIIKPVLVKFYSCNTALQVFINRFHFAKELNVLNTMSTGSSTIRFEISFTYRTTW